MKKPPKTYLSRIGYNIQIQPQIRLPCRHIIPYYIHRQVLLVLRYMRVRAHGLVLPIDEHPEPDLVVRVAEELGYPSFKRGVGLRFENTERMEL